jgi:hypothetical protein
MLTDVLHIVAPHLLSYFTLHEALSLCCVSRAFLLLTRRHGLRYGFPLAGVLRCVTGGREALGRTQGLAVDWRGGQVYAAATFEHRLLALSSTPAGRLGSLRPLPLPPSHPILYPRAMCLSPKGTRLHVTDRSGMSTLQLEGGRAASACRVPLEFGVAGSPSWPMGLCQRAADGALFVAGHASHCVQGIRPDGSTWVVAGREGVSGHCDGVGAAARFSHPRGLCCIPPGGPWGNTLVLADTGNFVLRAIARAFWAAPLGSPSGPFPLHTTHTSLLYPPPHTHKCPLALSAHWQGAWVSGGSGMALALLRALPAWATCSSPMACCTLWMWGPTQCAASPTLAAT